MLTSYACDFPHGRVDDDVMHRDLGLTVRSASSRLGTGISQPYTAPDVTKSNSLSSVNL